MSGKAPSSCSVTTPGETPQSAQFFRFLSVGAVNSLLGNGTIFASMYVAHLSPETSNVAGYTVGAITSYVLNRKYVFNSKQDHRAEIVRFLVVFLIAYAANLAMLVTLVHRGGLHEGASQLFAGVVFTVVSFLLNKHYAFNVSTAS